MFTAIADVNKWKRVIISQHDAKQQAMLEYMTKTERELWQKYFETLAQKKHLEDLLQTLHKPNDSYSFFVTILFLTNKFFFLSSFDSPKNATGYLF